MTPNNTPQPATSAHSDPNIWAPRLSRLLDEAIDLYTRLDALAQRQAQLIESEDHDALLVVLADRQVVVDRIAAHATHLDPFTSRWNELEPNLTSDHREVLRPRLDRLATLMDAIVKRDESDRHRLATMRDTTANELASLGRNQRAASAYNAGPGTLQTPPRYQDRTG